MSPKTALVFGASGVSGWAQARECLVYPTVEAFSRVIATSNRPLSKDAFQLSQYADRLDVYNGIDLTKGVDVVTQKLQGIQGINDVTHVYYAAYGAHGSDFQTLKAANVELLTTAVKAIKHACPRLEFWVLQTGAKYYGIEFYGQPGVVYEPPLKESSPRIPEPYASNVFYYSQWDELTRLNEGTKWHVCDTRPDMIVGYTPQSNNTMNFAQGVGLWLSMYASLEGKGAEVVFPGNDLSWKSLHRESSQDTVARLNIHVSLAPIDQVAGKAFNVADQLVNWEKLWPELCAYFGLTGVGPDDNAEGKPKKLTGMAWVMSKKPEWDKWVEANGLKGGILETTSWEFMEANLVFTRFDRQLDIEASKKIGFMEEKEPMKGYVEAFERMRKAKIIF